jgi:hypothetical protein
VQALQPCFAHLQVLQLGFAEASVAAALVPQMPELTYMELYQSVLPTEAATALSAVTSLRNMVLAIEPAAQVGETGWCALMSWGQLQGEVGFATSACPVLKLALSADAALIQHYHAGVFVGYTQCFIGGDYRLLALMREAFCCFHLALQACDVALLTQLTELQLVGHRVLQGDLQPLSKFQKLDGFIWMLNRDDLRQVAKQEWTEAMLQEAQQWAPGVKQQVQQFMLPSWTKLIRLFLDVEMHRGFLQTLATHCPQVEALGCSTLSIKESQPQIQLLRLHYLSLLFNLTGGRWYPNPLPVSSYAALRAPLLVEIYTAGKGNQRHYTTVSELQGCLQETGALLKSYKLSLLLVFQNLVSHWAHAGAGGSNQPPASERC